MKRIPSILAVLFTLSLPLLTGCASSEEKKMEAQRVSTVPWNKPQSWEGSGALGGVGDLYRN